MAHSREFFIRQAMDLARRAVSNGNHPFGALLVADDEVILTAENTVLTTPDVTGHAELNLVRDATRRFPAERLAECTLYTSTEPCAMCTGSIYWAGIPRVAYCCSAMALADLLGGADFLIPCRQLFQHGARPTEVIGPILEDEGLMIHREFWPTGLQRA
jgi:tRNA(Arg) A34 adenosine deaminase TadA